jgi:hypothetical protein
MAKNEKAKRARTKTSKAGKAVASSPPVRPSYLKKGQKYTMGLHNVVRALKVIEKHGHMAKFIKAAKNQELGGTFDSNTVNFVKDFMVKHKMHTDPIGKHIVNAQLTGRAKAAAPAAGRFNCNF